MTAEGVIEPPDRIGLARVWTCGPLASGELLSIAREQGERLSLSRKSEVVRVGEWVVKRSRLHRGAGPLRLTFRRRRYRRGYEAGRLLNDAGIGVPEVAGHVEWGLAGVVWCNATVTRFLNRHISIRDYALQNQSSREDDIARFLGALAHAVLALQATGAYHSDLAYKNVLTDEGGDIRFVDLDSILIGHFPSLQEQVRNHVQLVDAFYDVWPERHLSAFLRQLAPADVPFDRWMAMVVEGLEDRIHHRSAFERRALKDMERRLAARRE